LLVLDAWGCGSVRFAASIRLIVIGGSALASLIQIEFCPGNDAKVQIPRSGSMALGGLPFRLPDGGRGKVLIGDVTALPRSLLAGDDHRR
jgi:hypothetical protein